MQACSFYFTLLTRFRYEDLFGHHKFHSELGYACFRLKICFAFCTNTERICVNLNILLFYCPSFPPSKMINLSVPDTIDERAINKKKLTPFIIQVGDLVPTGSSNRLKERWICSLIQGNCLERGVLFSFNY